MPSTNINFKNIPVQAGIISRIISIDVESNNCFQELDDLISSDQGVASLLLRVVNSPFYSRGNSIATIPYAISLLGYGVVRSLALMAFSRSLFSHTKNPVFREHIWQHSLLAAIASQSICQQLGHTKLKDDAFVAGLMHDTGKVLMYSHDPYVYEQVFSWQFAQNCSSIAAERKFFGFDHCDAGREAVQEWKLPQRFIDYMGNEINASQVAHSDDPVLQSLRAANYLCKAAGIGANRAAEGIDHKARLLEYAIPEAVCEQMLHEDYLQQLMESETYQLCASM